MMSVQPASNLIIYLGMKSKIVPLEEMTEEKEKEEGKKKEKKKKGGSSYQEGGLDAMMLNSATRTPSVYSQSQQTTSYGYTGGHNSYSVDKKTAETGKKEEKNSYLQGALEALSSHRTLNSASGHNSQQTTSYGYQGGNNSHLAGAVARTTTGISRYGIDTFGEIAGAGKKAVATGARKIKRVVPDDLTQAGHSAQNIAEKVIGGGTKIAGEFRRNIPVDKFADKARDLVSQVDLGDAQRLGGNVLENGSKVAGQMAGNIPPLPIDKIVTTAGNVLKEVPSAIPSPRGCMQFIGCLAGLFR